MIRQHRKIAESDECGSREPRFGSLIFRLPDASFGTSTGIWRGHICFLQRVSTFGIGVYARER